MPPPSKLYGDQFGKVVTLEGGKAVIEFSIGKRVQRALLIAKSSNIYHRGRQLQDVKSLEDHLKLNDEVVFDCHEFDKPDGRDRASHFVIKVTIQDESPVKVGWISEVGRAWAVITWENSKDGKVRLN